MERGRDGAVRLRDVGHVGGLWQGGRPIIQGRGLRWRLSVNCIYTVSQSFGETALTWLSSHTQFWQRPVRLQRQQAIEPIVPSFYGTLTPLFVAYLDWPLVAPGSVSAAS